MAMLTRADMKEAERLGMTGREYERHLAEIGAERATIGPADPDPMTIRTPFRTRSRRMTTRDGLPGDVSISQTEYEALSVVAAIANRFLPLIDGAGAPITDRGAFQMLHEKLGEIARYGWGSTAVEGAAVADLVALLDDLKT